MEGPEALRRTLDRDRPRIPHSLTHHLTDLLGTYYQEHVRRNRSDGTLDPPETWQLVYGFLLAAKQTYDGICLLVEHKRPQPLLLQAVVLKRALFEYLINASVLLQNPKANTAELLRDAYRTNAVTNLSRQIRFGDDERWRAHFEAIASLLDRDAERLQLKPSEIEQPRTIRAWPTPGRLIKTRVTGALQQVLQNLYDNHYGVTSAHSHGRAMATSTAIVVAHPEYELYPDQPSHHVTTAQTMLACLWAEVSAAARFDVNPKLLEYWGYVRLYDDEAAEVWALRYRSLLHRDE
jgi:hypothetical protein